MELKDMIGKTVASVKDLGEWDRYGDEEDVSGVVRIDFTDGNHINLMAQNEGDRGYANIVAIDDDENGRFVDCDGDLLEGAWAPPI